MVKASHDVAMDDVLQILNDHHDMATYGHDMATVWLETLISRVCDPI